MENPFQSPQAVDSDANLPEVGPPYVFAGIGDVNDYIAGWRLKNVGWREQLNRTAGPTCLLGGSIILSSFIYHRLWPISFQSFAKLNQDDYGGLLIVFGMIICGLVATLGWRWRIRRWLNRMTQTYPNETVTFDANGIVVESYVTSTDFQWDDFRGFRNTDRTLVLLFDLPKKFMTLHRSCLKTVDAWPSLLHFVAERLPRK